MGLSNSSREPYALDLVVGARPNLVKVAPLIRELQHEDRLKFRLVHTGQHYDNKRKVVSEDRSSSVLSPFHSPMFANQWRPYGGSSYLSLEA